MLMPVIIISICFYIALRLISWQIPVLYRETVRIWREAHNREQ